MTVYARDVGLLLDRIDDPYQSELFSALRASALQRGVSLVCFVGGPASGDDESSPRDRLFELAARSDLAGVVVGAATLGAQSARAASAARMVAKLHPMPLVTLGTTLDAVPAVLLDNYDAMRTLVLHLAAQHGKRQIAFIRGPEQSEEAEERYRGYVRALFDQDIRPDEALILRGDGHRASGELAAATLLERRVEFDAVVAANDRMASGVIAELKRREIEVPGQIAVAGFDDSVEARYVSLTSMRAPTRVLAELALDALLDPAARSTHVLPAELLLRRSCGCESDLRVRATPPPHRGEPELPLLRRRTDLVSAMRRAAPFAERDEWPEELFASFVSDVRGKTQGAFASHMEHVLELAARENQDPNVVQGVVDVFRMGALPALTELPGMLLRAEATLYGAGLAIAGALQSDGQRYGLSFHDALLVLSSLAHDLTKVVSLEHIGVVLARHLPRLGVTSAGIATCRGTPSRPNYTVARLEWAWCWGNPDAHWWKPRLRSAPPPEQPFAAVALPLAFEDRLLGVATFDAGPMQGVVFEMLRALLSSALAHAAREDA